MESMRSLNTSLPKSSSRRAKSSVPPAGLVEAFKVAARSVTQLYRAAAAEEDASQAAGYQDAMNELLALLDNETVGLEDVRRWATERLTPELYGSDSEVDDDGGAEAKLASQRIEQPTTAPGVQVNGSEEEESAGPATDRLQAPPANATSHSHTTKSEAPSQTSPTSRHRHSDIFHFTANQPTSDVDMSASSASPTMAPPTALRVNVRRSSSRRRRSRDPMTPTSSITQAAGVKRRSSGFPDWSDVDGFSKDWHGYGGGGPGAAKRGRWSE